jgi:hypothetical protein
MTDPKYVEAVARQLEEQLQAIMMRMGAEIAKRQPPDGEEEANLHVGIELDTE